MLDFQCAECYDINDYIKIMKALRSPEGCPWDRAQTHESIRRNLLEEALEVAEAIDEGSTEHLKEELGDLLMQVIFHCEMESERGSFDFSDVCDASVKKLVARHPHVFGEKNAEDSAEALELWEKQKMLGYGQKSELDAMQSVAKTLPASWRAEKLIKKSGGWSFGMSADELLQNSFDKAREDKTALGGLMLAALCAAHECGLDGEKLLSEACESYIAAYRDEKSK